MKLSVFVVGLVCMLCACLPASAQWRASEPAAGYWPVGCKSTTGLVTSTFPDSIIAPKDYRIARVDFWNGSVVAGNEALTVIAKMYEPSAYTSSATASCNTSFVLTSDNTKGYGPNPFSFFGSTDKIWLTATAGTTHWSWCAYLVYSAGDGAATETSIGQFTPGVWTPQ